LTRDVPAVDLSVVIATHDASRVIETCLEALDAQRGARQLEVIVADSSTDDTRARIARGYPWVRVIPAGTRAGIPVLRGLGIAAAQGAVVAILDPFSVAAPDWVAQVLDAHARQPHLVIGGAVGLQWPESRSLSEWTVYLNEYGLFMPPVVQGETWIVPGSNVSYKRAALFAGDRPRHPLFWKTFVNQDLERAGFPMWLEPAVRVDLNKPIPFGRFLVSRYDHGRCFGGMRVEDATTGTRVVRALAAPAVPAVLLWRWTRGFWPKRSTRMRFVVTLPGQLALFAVWAVGEFVGSLRGPGRSCDRLHF
jgi:glycosyltransferase involved in cell wall biosynthesis